MLQVLTFLFLLLFSAKATFAEPTASTGLAPDTAVVRTSVGPLEGRVIRPGIFAFLGIPYAAPPIGALRWHKPMPAASWSGIRPALEHGAPCAQLPAGWNDALAARGSEDCLYLNVWTADLAHDAHRPVMVYIHGGSNTSGSASEELSNGISLTPRGVVLVTLNYRVGVFGFLSSAELAQEVTPHAAGDYGILDQIAALTWVHQHIADFGGDPANVTIFGQSAGSVDVGTLMASPLARGLFQKAIEESGTVLGLMPPATAAQSQEGWAPVRDALGHSLDKMRQASTAEVLAASNRENLVHPQGLTGYRGVSIDGWVLPTNPAVVFSRGEEAPVPLIIGSNAWEIVPSDKSAASVRKSLDESLGQRAARAETLYEVTNDSGSGPNGPTDPIMGPPFARWATDRLFRCPARMVAAWHSQHGHPTFQYQFERPQPGQEEAMHSSELAYVFHTFHGGHGGKASFTADDEQLSEVLECYWTNFARTGDPNGAGVPTWPASVTNDQLYLEFKRDGSESIGSKLGGEACTIYAADQREKMAR